MQYENTPFKTSLLMAFETDSAPQPKRFSGSSPFERLVANNPPILSSLVAQLPTESILSLYHTSWFLQSFLRQSPTSWRYISWRLHQPALATTPPNAAPGNNGQRQSSNYALDQLLMYAIIPYSTRLVSLELDNTAVSGATLFQTVMISRKETLEHVSVRGCKNVSLKYHINPWLMMHAMALDQPPEFRPPELQNLALKSLYTYRCRHHRRRPYLPSSLARKESDSEPTHELVLTCHKLGIWTDTAWCTTPGARCYRRRGYVTMRVPQDPREVWVVYDRLWRSRNWLGPIPDQHNASRSPVRKRKRDGRVWEYEEEAANGEPVGTGSEGKEVPTHLRSTHQQFVEDVYCDNCSDRILERCEQCSVMMHCSGCRKTLCASCAFDRPYTRNRNAPEDEKNKFWWAPGCAVSPCSMQDIDPAAPGTGPQSNALPNIKFKWCCTEPVFSGGGGITFGLGQNTDTDSIRAAPLKAGNGFEDAEFSPHDDEGNSELMGAPLSRSSLHGPGGRWASIADLFRQGHHLGVNDTMDSVPRILCDDCHSSEQWKIKCKACAVALCLKHDVKERQRVRICGYKDLALEKQDLIARIRAVKLITALILRKRKLREAQEASRSVAEPSKIAEIAETESQIAQMEEALAEQHGWTWQNIPQAPKAMSAIPEDQALLTHAPLRTSESNNSALEPIDRPLSPGSNSTGPPSRSSSPAPSARSTTATPEPQSTAKQAARFRLTPPSWRGCQAFFCPSSRPPGDHRRRCNATMRQCQECKIHVCEDCVTGLEKPCPCKGCRVPETEGDANAINAAFFCPTCRWTRMVNGKCKRRPNYLSRKSSSKKKDKKRKNKKPIEERKSYRATQQEGDALESSISDIELNEFFASMHLEEEAEFGELPREIRELQDMGMMARDLIRRIQILRQQAGPGSAAAMALPDVRLENVANSNQAEVESIISLSESVDQMVESQESQ